MSEPTSEPAPTAGSVNQPDPAATTASMPAVVPVTAAVPVAAVPVTAVPLTESIPVAEAPRPGRAVWVLGVVVVVLVLAAGALAAVFVTYRQDADRRFAAQQAQITDLQGKVAARGTTIASHDSELNSVRTAVAAAKQKADARQACPGSVQALVDKIKTSGQAPTADEVLAMVRVCGVTL